MSRNIYFAKDMEDINSQYEAEDDTPIFRYMDFSKFIDLLENKTLYFCNSKYFEDKYEGVLPEGFYKNWPEDAKEGHKNLTQEFEKYFGAYISCWNKAEDESYALWKIYTNPETGVAIKSTVGDLRMALNDKNIKFYNAKYIRSFDNMDEDHELPFYQRETEDEPKIFINRRVKEVFKLASYVYENELRVIYIENSNLRGKSFSVEINRLIKEIYVSPFASEWFYKLIEKIKLNDRYSISDKPIHKSKILIRK